MNTFEIIDKACKYYNVDKYELLSSKRSRHLVSIRTFITMYLRTTTTLSYEKIGFYLNRNHATVINYKDNHENNVRIYYNYAEQYQEFCDHMKNKKNSPSDYMIKLKNQITEELTEALKQELRKYKGLIINETLINNLKL